jgi:hypothetical protein
MTSFELRMEGKWLDKNWILFKHTKEVEGTLQNDDETEIKISKTNRKIEMHIGSHL